MQESRAFRFTVQRSAAGRRLDLFVSLQLSDCSRSRAADLIRRGLIRVGGDVKKPGYRLHDGEIVFGSQPEAVAAVYEPEPIPIDILFEDAHVIVINKASGMVVHPAPGHGQGTLVNALLCHCADLGDIGGEIRPGIVHRLDKDTSGTMVVAKTEYALNHLARQFKSRSVEKTYLALVLGDVKSDTGEISFPIGRHPVDRKRMSVRSRTPRDAETHWRVRERFDGATLLEVSIKTGRTHQIRVHCAAVHHPIVGDSVYGGRKMKKETSLMLKSGEKTAITRQMLHAWRLVFEHPHSGEKRAFESPLPADMADLLDSMRGT
ncbi:MAG: RluA family pseudouridine synthase [Deltaproteobacteria bacterium]|nr:RluA family pseudouridine synthase [Deltaproteobacteria bacterium]